MAWVVGVDGCRGGWAAVWVYVQQSNIVKYSLECLPRVRDVFGHHSAPKVVTVDMPIGLLSAYQTGGRTCDREARQILKRRASSVFSPPIREQLNAQDYERVRLQGLSRQSFHLIPKIREIDFLMTPELQTQVHEAHPELVFATLAGDPMQYNKKTQEGRRERSKALARINLWPFSPIPNILRSLIRPFSKGMLAPDDVIDAWALAWTASCIDRKNGRRVPERPPIDRKRLRMEIWF